MWLFKKDNKLQQKLNKIQQELKAPKNQKNSFGKYNYRSCEDILEAVKPLLDGAILIVSDKIVNIGDRYYVEATASLSEGNEVIETTAYAREAETKKGMDEAQITGATSSYARKYALNGLFAIDDTKDADTMDNSKPKETPSPAPKATLFRKMNESVGRTITANETALMIETIEKHSGIIIKDVKELDQYKCKGILEMWNA